MFGNPTEAGGERANRDHDDNAIHRQPYGGKPPFEKTSDTSKAASESVIGAAVSIRLRVLHLIVQTRSHGATDDEIEEALGLRHQTASARRRELVLNGRVEDSGLRRNTRSGRSATVWIAL